MTVEVVVAALEELMILNVEDHIEIARRTAFIAGIAFTGDSELGSIINAGRDLQLDRFFANDAALAVAERTTVLDDLARPVALVATARDAEDGTLILVVFPNAASSKLSSRS